MARRQHVILSILLGATFLFTLSYLYSGPGSASARDAARLIANSRFGPQRGPRVPDTAGESKPDFKVDLDSLPGNMLDGGSIAPKLENATLKAELGRATWKFLHTTVARYPEKPTPENRKMLELFFFALGQLYPCGDCAEHFRGLLKELPPQTSSRNAAAGWLCEAHNRVNTRLQKPLFDCSKIGDFYDCGCGDEDKKGKGSKDKSKESPKDKGRESLKNKAGPKDKEGAKDKDEIARGKPPHPDDAEEVLVGKGILRQENDIDP